MFVSACSDDSKAARRVKTFSKSVVEDVIFHDKEALKRAEQQACITVNTGDPLVAEYMYLRINCTKDLINLLNQAHDKESANQLAGPISIWTYNYNRTVKHLREAAHDSDKRAEFRGQKVDSLVKFLDEMDKQVEKHKDYLNYLGKLTTQAALNCRIEDYYGSESFRKAVQEAMSSVRL